jgi:hypothetical protein
MKIEFAGTAALGTLLAAVSCFGASAAPATFTLDPKQTGPALAGAGPAFTADSISTTDFLFNISDAAATGTDTFILQINGFSLGGVPVSVPSLNTSYGLYIEGTVAIHGTPSVYGPGTIALVADPTNNDGTASAVWNAATQTGGVAFANPANTVDDITLATGNFITGSFGTQANGLPRANFLETFVPDPAQSGFFVSPFGVPMSIDEALFNTATSRVTGPTTDPPGGSWTTANNGFGVANLRVPEPTSVTLLGVGVALTAAVHRRERRSGGIGRG